MTTGFQHQQSSYVPMPRAVPRPQHGAGGRPVETREAQPLNERRSFR